MSDSGGGIISNLRDYYDNFIASLEEKGVPSPGTIVPVAAAVILIAIALLLSPSLLNPTTTVEFTVLNSEGSTVVGADVTLTAGEYSQSTRSLSTGTASFDKVPAGKTYSVSVTASGYQPKTSVVEDKGTITLSKSTPSQKKTFKVKVVDKDKTEVEDASVTLKFSDGNKMDKYTDVYGEASFDLTGVTQTAATAEISKDSFDTKTMGVSFDDGTVTISLKDAQKPADTKGDFIVKVSNDNSDGAIVSIVDVDTSLPIARARVDSSGKALFPQITIGAKFTISASDPEGRFSNYENSDNVVSFDKNLQIETITLKVPSSSKDGLTITVKSKGGSDRISGANVRIYDRASKAFYDEAATDSNGNARFTVSGKTYYVTAFKEGYAPGFADNTHTGETRTIELDKAGEGATIEAGVAVTENGDGVPDAEVNVFKSNGFPLGIPPISTSGDGTSKFNLPLNLDGKGYRVYAIAKLDNKVGASDLADVADGMTLSIAIQAPPANITLVAKSMLANDTISDAVFSLVTPGDTIAKDCASPCNMLVPPGVEYRIIATASGFLQMTSAPITFSAGEKKKVEILLYPLSLSKKNAISFIGFYDQNGNSVAELQRAETYVAKFAVAMGEKSNAYAFFQGGESSDNASDAFQITDFKSGIKPKTVLSGQNTDAICTPPEKTQGDTLKWIELDYASQLGATEVEIEFQVKPNAPSGVDAKILYRLGGTTATGGVPFTSPQDDDLLNQLLSQAVKDRTAFCSAKTNSASVKLSSTPMVCKDGLCTRIAFEGPDGFKTANNIAVKLGDQFKLNFELFAPGQQIDSVSVAEDPTLEIVSGSVGQLNLADKTFTATGTDRSTGSITFRALKETSKTAVKLTVNFAGDKNPIEIDRGVEITGKNSFKISFTPSTANAGETVRAEAILIDSIGRPATDAQVTLYNCNENQRVLGSSKIILGTNVAGQGEDGKYDFTITPATVGDVCLEARGEGFATKTVEPVLTSSAEDFITADPLQIQFKGPVNLVQPQRVEVTSLLAGTKIKISSAVNQECAQLLVVTPSMKDKVEGSTQFTVGLASQDAISADCLVAFVGEANPGVKAAVILPVNINTSAVDCSATNSCPELPKCEPDNACLSAEDGSKFGCAPRNDLSCTSGKSCFVCGTGLDNINEIRLTISNLKNDRKVFPIFLNFEPKFNEEFDLQWDQQINTQLPVRNNPQFQNQQPYGNYGYPINQPGMGYDQYFSQNYGVNPYYSTNYPYGTGYGYSQYQTLPYYQNPIRTGVPPESLGTQYPYQQISPPGAGGLGNYGYGAGGYGYGNYNYGQGAVMPQYCAPFQQGFQGQQQIATGGMYPGITPNQPVVPPYCYSFAVNFQSGYSAQYTGAGQNPYYPSVPYGMPPNCQYPTICNNPQACSYVAYGQGLPSFGSLPPECQYPAVCGNSGKCSYYNGQQPQSTAQTKQVGNPVKVNVDLSKQQLVVSAVYSGDEYFFNGGQAASARGTIIIRDDRGVEKKRIPLVVSISYSGVIPNQGNQAGGQPPQQPPFGQQPYSPAYQPQMPQECFALFYPQACAPQGGAGGIGALLKLPDNMVVVTNLYTGKGLAEYPFEPPRAGSGVIDCLSRTSVSGVTCKIGNTDTPLSGIKPGSTAGKTKSSDTQGTVNNNVPNIPAIPATQDNVNTPASSSGKPTIILTAKLPASRKLDEDTGKVTATLSTQVEKKVEKEFTVRKDDFKPQKIQLFLLDKIDFKDKVEYADVSVGKENCKFGDKSSYASVSCDGTLVAEAKGKEGSTALLTISGLGDNQIREIPVVVSRVTSTPANFIIRLTKESKATAHIVFKPGLELKMDGDDAPLLEVDASSAQTCPDGSCVTAKFDKGDIVVEADYKSKATGGKLPLFLDQFVIKLTLQGSIERSTISIPIFVTTDQTVTDSTKPVIDAPNTALTGKPVTVKVRFPLGDDASQRVVEVTGFSADNKTQRPLTEKKTGDNAAKEFTFNMVNTPGSYAIVSASTKFPGATKASEAVPKTISTTASDSKSTPPANSGNTGGSGESVQPSGGGSKGGTGTGVGKTGSQVNYGTCTVKAGIQTIKTTSSGKSKVKLSKSQADMPSGQCGDVTACVKGGGTAYSGFCSGPGTIQCCITGGSSSSSGSSGAVWPELCFKEGETNSIALGGRGYTITPNTDRGGTTFNVKAGSDTDASKTADSAHTGVCTFSAGVTSKDCGEVVLDEFKYVSGSGSSAGKYCVRITQKASAASSANSPWWRTEQLCPSGNIPLFHWSETNDELLLSDGYKVRVIDMYFHDGVNRFNNNALPNTAVVSVFDPSREIGTRVDLQLTSANCQGCTANNFVHDLRTKQEISVTLTSMKKYDGSHPGFAGKYYACLLTTVGGKVEGGSGGSSSGGSATNGGISGRSLTGGAPKYTIEKTVYSSDSKTDRTIIADNGYWVRFKGVDETGWIGSKTKCANFLIWEPSTKTGDDATYTACLSAGDNSYDGDYVKDALGITAVKDESTGQVLSIETSGPKKEDYKVTFRVASKNDVDILKTKIRQTCAKIVKYNEVKDTPLSPKDCIWLDEFDWLQLKTVDVDKAVFTHTRNGIGVSMAKIIGKDGGDEYIYLAQKGRAVLKTKKVANVFTGSVTIEG